LSNLLLPSDQRNKKGTLVTWLLVLAIFGLTFVMTVISLELLIKWITFNRIQEAAQSATLSYAREIIKLRDNEMGETQQYGLSLQDSVKAQGCTSPSYSGCTDYDGESIEKDINKSEYISASQIFLFNIWNQGGSKAVKDAFSIGNVRQGQCYKEATNTRFNKFGESSKLKCQAIGNVISPITDLRWAFHTGTYNSGDKDLCVETHVSARLDPVMAGGLCFLNGSCGLGADFIRIGPVSIIARAVVMKAGFEVDTGAGFSRSKADRFYNEGAENYSAESVFIETCSNPTDCANQKAECQINRGTGIVVPL
jgi:hypothetical protein